MTGWWRWGSSLRLRMLAATLVALSLALLLAGVVLSGLFRDHVMRQFERNLILQLDQLTAHLDFDTAGHPRIDSQALTDPRWQKPFSGLYWQVDHPGGHPAQAGVLRSRSLWDTTLALDDDGLVDGAVHVHRGPGPQDTALLMIERTVRPAEQPQARWRLVVASDLQDAKVAVNQFTGVLAASLGLLLVLLVLAALAQVAVGLAPLKAMQRALADVRKGLAPRLAGRFPAEVQALIDDFNSVLDRNEEVVARSRTHAGNLAHAIKTPLAVLDQAAARATAPASAELARLVRDQVALSRRHVDWHLARARAAASQRMPGQRTPVEPVIQGLIRVMDRLFAARAIRIECAPTPHAWAFAGEEQDMQEILGNLIENACKWARSLVRISFVAAPEDKLASLRIFIEDDGPGIDPSRREAVLARGTRVDESVPGTGLGLAIAQDLVDLYGGTLTLASSPLDGLRVVLDLPAVRD